MGGSNLHIYLKGTGGLNHPTSPGDTKEAWPSILSNTSAPQLLAVTDKHGNKLTASMYVKHGHGQAWHLVSVQNSLYTGSTVNLHP